MASKKRSWRTLDASAIPLLYTPIERAALAKYLDFNDPAPAELSEVDLTETVDPDEWDQETLGIAPLASPMGDETLQLENVVARICLESVQHSLPQWALVRDASVTLGRRVTKARSLVRDLESRRLFTINWADSGPGYSWPETYYCTYLPGYDIHVVTASNDSPDASGYCDFAIGWFASTENEWDGIERCVKSRWSGTRGYGQERWAYLFDTGKIDEATAHAWADEVWGKDGDEQEDADVDR